MITVLMHGTVHIRVNSTHSALESPLLHCANLCAQPFPLKGPTKHMGIHDIISHIQRGDTLVAPTATLTAQPGVQPTAPHSAQLIGQLTALLGVQASPIICRVTYSQNSREEWVHTAMHYPAQLCSNVPT
jgi:hypothetical protein